jgi:hypothetical protein
MTDVITPVLLVDFENIQDLDYLKKLRNTDFEVRVFLGPHQSKLPSSLVRQAQPFGARLQWIQMEGNGKNALDFHIAYTIGLLSTESKKRQIFVLSKDTGFDPLLTYLGKRGLACTRIEELAEALPTRSGQTTPIKTPQPDTIPNKSISDPKAPLTFAEIRIFADSIPPKNRPKTPKGLAACLATHFKKQGAGADFSVWVNELEKAGKVMISDKKLSFLNK